MTASPVVDDDAELVAASRSDPDRFALLYDRHFTAVYRYLTARLGTQTADDLAAETFLIAFRGRDRYDPERGIPRAWLFGIATRLVARHHRAEERRHRALTLLTAEPGAETVAAGRARLLAEARRPSRRRFRVPRPALVTGFGTALAGASAAVALMMASGTATPRAPGATGSSEAPKDAFVQVAAKAELQPGGRFWHSDQISGQAYAQRPATGPYTIFGAQYESFQYTSVDKKGGSDVIGREVSARPASPEDEAAWRRAGSPSSFRVWSNDHYAVYKAGTTPWTADKKRKGGSFFLPGKGVEPTPDQVANLPTDPAALARFLFPVRDDGIKNLTYEEIMELRRQEAAGKNVDWGHIPPRQMKPEERMDQVAEVLLNLPVSPKQRSALMRTLAAQPGVHVLKEATDTLGRRGIALVTDPWQVTRTGESGAPKAERGSYTVQDELIFDPATGALLSSQRVLVRPGGPYASRKPGAVDGYRAVRSSGWTDTRPEPPVESLF
ncbi:CU044_5270 family protein [Actinomadura harenae]|uniref:CU044_5270 family protein n=1 Tax=Actinomadura harenae TaxID=2483351 RepID=UPI0018F66606|nr:CU044_5270 family protein [Actinomadura harenae]